jgi:hypothetical protein
MEKALNLPNSIQSLDIIHESQSSENLIVVVFGQSPSINYPLAVELAKRAHKYGLAKLSKQDLHMAVFSKTKEQTARAAALLKLVGKWKSCQIYTATRILNDAYQMTEVLECYLKSLSNKDPKSHCHWSYQSYPSGKFLLPCKQLQGWVHLVTRDHQYHVTDMKNRIHALSVEKGCDWCPHYKADAFKSL